MGKGAVSHCHLWVIVGTLGLENLGFWDICNNMEDLGCGFVFLFSLFFTSLGVLVLGGHQQVMRLGWWGAPSMGWCRGGHLSLQIDNRLFIAKKKSDSCSHK